MQSLWIRLKDRKLVQWALAYLAGAWLLLQVFGKGIGLLMRGKVRDGTFRKPTRSLSHRPERAHSLRDRSRYPQQCFEQRLIDIHLALVLREITIAVG